MANLRAMKPMLIFLLLFVAGLLFYVTWHLWRVTPGRTAKWVVAGLFLLWAASAMASMMVRDSLPIPVTEALYEVGQPWVVGFAYLGFAFFLADIALVLRLLPKGTLKDNLPALLVIVGVVGVVMVAGGIHYRHKYRQEMTVTTDKPIGKDLTVVFASDIHVGYSNHRKELARWIDLINAEHPDLVLFGGDVIDNRLRPLYEGGFDQEFRRLTAPTYAVLGNHEYFSGADVSKAFLAQAGITVLQDSVVRFEGIDIIGRDDAYNSTRASLMDLADTLQGFTILLDHQPRDLKEAQDAGIDIQLSGHTHRGQFWPYTIVTDMMYEKSWGPYRRGDTQYYISSGMGIWGPKIRIGTRSEYLVLHIKKTRP